MEPHRGQRGKREGRRFAPAGSSARVIVIVPHLARRALKPGERGAARGIDARLEEAVGLARAIDLDVASAGIVPLAQIKPATFLGKGKVEEIAGIVRAEEAGLVFVDGALSPVQQRNLEKAWGAKVVDRTGLILEIFGERAHTKEGTLQVELAHLNYQKSRLVRSWTHLERQRGGFGFLGGPGETQIEADRRQIGERIGRIERELERVKRTRALHRENRKRVPYPIVALVGYTNAGKSTLFNTLTKASVRAEDLLFATLDPTLRAVDLPSGTRAIVSDTVGFISELPTMLIAAFRATLEEVTEADIVVHVRDCAHEDSMAQAGDVAGILARAAAKYRRAASARCAAGAGVGADRRGDGGASFRDRHAARGQPHIAFARARSGRRRRSRLAASPGPGARPRHARRRAADGHRAGGFLEARHGPPPLSAGDPHFRLSPPAPPRSASFAASHSASISAKSDCAGVLPRKASARSIA